MPNYDALREAFIKESAHSFVTIAKLLQTLEIPINVVPGRFQTGEEVTLAMVKSRELVAEAPMPIEHRAALNTVMTLWLAAMYLANRAAEDGMWLLEAATVQMIRINEELEMTAAVLRGEAEVTEIRKLRDDRE